MNPQTTQNTPPPNNENNPPVTSVSNSVPAQSPQEPSNEAKKPKKKILGILGFIVATLIILPFIFGLYSVGPVEFPCTYQQVQGKKALKKLQNDIQGLSISNSSASKIASSTSLDCLDGSLNDPMSVKATFNLTSPVSLSEAEAAVLANQQINNSEMQQSKPITSLGANKDDTRMREVRISGIETSYSGNGKNKYKVVYNFQTSVACSEPTPPESKLDDSVCKSKTVVKDLGLDKQPIDTITISRTVIPSQE